MGVACPGPARRRRVLRRGLGCLPFARERFFVEDLVAAASNSCLDPVNPEPVVGRSVRRPGHDGARPKLVLAPPRACCPEGLVRRGRLRAQRGRGCRRAQRQPSPRQGPRAARGRWQGPLRGISVVDAQEDPGARDAQALEQMQPVSASHRPLAPDAGPSVSDGARRRHKSSIAREGLGRSTCSQRSRQKSLTMLERVRVSTPTSPPGEHPAHAHRPPHPPLLRSDGGRIRS